MCVDVVAYGHEISSPTSQTMLRIVCDNAKETCSIYPGHAHLLHHSFEDRATVEGSEEQRISAFRVVRDQIRQYLRNFPEQ